METPRAVGARLITGVSTPLRIDDHVAVGKKLIRHADGLVHIAAAVLTQIHDIRLCSLRTKRCQRRDELVVSLLAELIYADKTNLLLSLNDELRIHRVDRYVAARDGEMEQLRLAAAHYANLHLRPFLAAQRVHYLLIVDMLAHEERVVHGDEFVACHHAHALARTASNHCHDTHRIVLYVKLHPDTRERS